VLVIGKLALPLVKDRLPRRKTKFKRFYHQKATQRSRLRRWNPPVYFRRRRAWGSLLQVRRKARL